MALHSRWGKASFRTPDGMSFKDWRKSPEYRSAISQYCKDRYEKNKSIIDKKNNAFYNTTRGRASSMLTASRARSKKKGLAFDLDIDWIEEKLLSGKCELTGMPFSYVRGIGEFGKKHPFSPSIDRINNSLGYTKNNCRIILWSVNAAIADFGIDTYLEVAKLVIKNIEGEYKCPR